MLGWIERTLIYQQTNKNSQYLNIFQNIEKERRAENYPNKIKCTYIYIYIHIRRKKEEEDTLIMKKEANKNKK